MSMAEWKLGNAATCPRDKKYFFAHFPRSWSMFSCGVPRSPLKKKKRQRLVRLPVLPFRQIACLGLCYLPARRRERRWHSMHFSQEAGQAEVTGRAQTRRQGRSPTVYWVVSSFKGKHGDWGMMTRTVGKSLNLSEPQSWNLPNGNDTYSTYSCELSHRHEIHFTQGQILWNITSCLPLTSLFLPDLSPVLGSHWFQQSWCCRPCVRQKRKQIRKWKSMIPYHISQAYSQNPQLDQTTFFLGDLCLKSILSLNLHVPMGPTWMPTY